MHNIIIVGNGLTGGVLACALAQKGFDVALVDQQSPSHSPRPDARSFALSQSSVRLLRTTHIWDGLEGVTPIRSIHTSDGVLPRWVRYEETEIEEGPLGYVIESSRLKEGVLQKLLSLNNITLYAPTTVRHFEQGEASVTLETSRNETLKSQLCIASDGRSSFLRKKARIPLWEWRYDQTAIVCTVAHTLPHYNQAFEYFLPSGPLAFLPREGQTSGIVWSIETKKAHALLNLSPEEFTEELSANFGSSLGNLTLISERFSYPLEVCLPKRIIDTRLAFVGDAAHSFHPVAGQGLNVGFRDVGALVSLLTEAKSLGLDLGSYTLLGRYQRERRADIVSMTLLTDGIVRAFSNPSRGMAHVRALGFWAVNHLSPLKRFMIRHASGVSFY